MLYYNQRLLIGLNTAFSLLAIAAVVMRFANRWTRRLKPALDDWLCLGALVGYLGDMVIVYIMILHGGAGKPQDKYTPQELMVFFKMTAAVQFTYAVCMGLVRASIIVLVMQIFSTSKKFRRVCQVILGFTIAWTLYVLLQAIVLCRPFRTNWDRNLIAEGRGSCGNQVALYIGIVTWGLVLDLAIFIAPIPMIWRLKMPVNQRIGLTLLFALGLFDTITGAMRLVSTTQGVFNVITEALAWSILEPSVAIFIACTPKCRQIFDKLTPTHLFENISIRSLLRSSRRSHKSASLRNSSQSSEDDFHLVKGVQRSGKSSVTAEVSQVDHPLPPMGAITVKKDFDAYSMEA